LHRFHAGARIRLSDGEALLADPLRRPRDFLRTLFSPAATLGDKLRVVRLRLRPCGARGSRRGFASASSDPTSAGSSLSGIFEPRAGSSSS
jgi:hypothetical protein